MKKNYKCPARQLSKNFNLNVEDAYYHKDGKFYNPLERFPAAFFDDHGYVYFPTKADYEKCDSLSIGKKVNVKGELCSIPGYVKVI